MARIAYPGDLFCLVHPTTSADPNGDRAAQAVGETGSDFVVVLDPGHGGQDSGAVCGTMLEKDLTLDVAVRAERLLRVAGFTTVLTRDERSLHFSGGTGFVRQSGRQFALCQHSFQRWRARRRVRRGNLLLARTIRAVGHSWWLPFFQRARPCLDGTEPEPGELSPDGARRAHQRGGSRDQGWAVFRYCQCPASGRPRRRRFHDEQIRRDEAEDGGISSAARRGDQSTE